MIEGCHLLSSTTSSSGASSGLPARAGPESRRSPPAALLRRAWAATLLIDVEAAATPRASWRWARRYEANQARRNLFHSPSIRPVLTSTCFALRCRAFAASPLLKVFDFIATARRASGSAHRRQGRFEERAVKRRPLWPSSDRRIARRRDLHALEAAHVQGIVLGLIRNQRRGSRQSRPKNRIVIVSCPREARHRDRGARAQLPEAVVTGLGIVAPASSARWRIETLAALGPARSVCRLRRARARSRALWPLRTRRSTTSCVSITAPGGLVPCGRRDHDSSSPSASRPIGVGSAVSLRGRVAQDSSSAAARAACKTLVSRHRARRGSGAQGHADDPPQSVSRPPCLGLSRPSESASTSLRGTGSLHAPFST